MTDERNFVSLFGRRAAFSAEAPGRVNLIGEHTDYNGGFVLPTAIPLKTTVQLALRDDKVGRVSSASVGDDSPRSYLVGDEILSHSWLDYVQGVTFALRASGVPLRGFDALIQSSLPLGAGLSSSAALEISLLRALRQGLGLRLDDVTLARLGRAAETDFVGAPVGIMDQMAASLADEGTALFLDTRSLAFERVILPPSVDLIVIDSGVAHDHATGDYKTRRRECAEAAALLGVGELRDVGIDRLHEVERLPSPLNRRARHVITENGRVLAAVSALRRGDIPAVGDLFKASHVSMRDDFEVSVPAIDRLVQIADSEPAVFGSRLTGGGFGGSIVALVPRGDASNLATRIARAAGEPARALVPGVTP